VAGRKDFWLVAKTPGLILEKKKGEVINHGETLVVPQDFRSIAKLGKDYNSL